MTINTRFISTRSVAAIAVATSVVAISFSLADAATAEPSAPPSATSTSQTFIVPADASRPNADIPIGGRFDNTFGVVDPDSFTVTLVCDDGSTFSTSLVGEYDINSTSSGWNYDYYLNGTLPAREHGHTCTATTTAPSGRQLVVSQPENAATLPLTEDLLFSGQVVTVVSSKRGGQY